jgi:hypothetical protein
MRLTVLALSLAFAPLASADMFNITADNVAGALCTVASPCGTVTVTGTSTLHVVISMNAPFGVFGNNDTFGFNVVGPTAGVTMSGFSNASFNGNGGSGNEDGWGNFNFRVDGPGGSSAVSLLSFDVTRSGVLFTGPSDIEAGATGGNGFTTFGLHVRNNTSGLTGYAGVSAAASVPEPTSVILLGTMVAGAFFMRRRRGARSV